MGRKIVTSALLIAALAAPVGARDAESPMAAIEQLFEGMRTANAEMAREVLAHTARIVAVSEGEIRAQTVDHVAVVDDLVAHVDRRAVEGQRLLDDLDGALDPGAETARTGQQDLHGLGHVVVFPRQDAFLEDREALARCVPPNTGFLTESHGNCQHRLPPMGGIG